MKKLMMFAAAMTIVGGAYAQCGLGDTPGMSCALVYNAKFSVKTTKGKPYSGKCDDLCYRAKASVSYKGFLYVCACSCDEFLQDGMFYLSGNKKNSEVFEGAPEWTVLNKIGKKNLDAEGFFNAELSDLETGREFNLAAAGFGKFDKKTGHLTSMSGNLVGVMSAPECEIECATGEPAVAFPACDWDESDDVATIAYGSWSIKYNKKLSKRYLENTWEPGM